MVHNNYCQSRSLKILQIWPLRRLIKQLEKKKKKVSLGILCVKNYDQREQMLCQWRKAKLAKVQIYSATQGYTQGTWVNIPFTEAFSGE